VYWEECSKPKVQHNNLTDHSWNKISTYRF